MDAYYECHVTVSPSEKETTERLAKAYGWHTSQILRDEVMGDDAWLYCTRSGPDFDKIEASMHTLTAALRNGGVTVRRQKIEIAIVDERF